MNEILQQILFFFGNGLCHQIPSRTFEAGGLYFSVCARDTGIYVGLIVTLVVFAFMYTRSKEKPAALPPAWAVVASVVLIAPMAIDGVASTLRLYDTNNIFRYITGYLCGSGVAVLASGGLFNLWKNVSHKNSAISSPAKLWTVLVASFAFGVAFVLVHPYLGVIAPLFALACQVTAFTFVNLLILSTTRFWQGAPPSKHVVLVALCLAAALAELALFSLAASALEIAFPWAMRH